MRRRGPAVAYSFDLIQTLSELQNLPDDEALEEFREMCRADRSDVPPQLPENSARALAAIAAGSWYGESLAVFKGERVPATAERAKRIVLDFSRGNDDCIEWRLYLAAKLLRLYNAYRAAEVDAKPHHKTLVDCNN